VGERRHHLAGRERFEQQQPTMPPNSPFCHCAGEVLEQATTDTNETMEH
jgi:hypothetical protein